MCSNENVLSKEDLELLSSCVLIQMDKINQIPTCMDVKLMEARDDLRRRLVELNYKICNMIQED